MLSIEQTESSAAQSNIELIRNQSKDKADAVVSTVSKPSRASNRIMKMIRRIHLYSGIFMFPFVLLYGFTGWFFNHPSYFTGDQVTTFSAAEIAAAELGQLPTPKQLADDVVTQLNKESAAVDGPEIALTDTRTPLFTGFLSYSVKADDATHQVTINPVTGDGEVRTTFDEDEEATDDGPPKNPIEMISRVDVDRNPLIETESVVPALLKGLNLSTGEAKIGRRTPNLVFSTDVDGVPTVVTYSLEKGNVGGLREDAETSMRSISFLQRMHLSRRYSPQINIRWLWALQVDLMFVSMVFWGGSGLLMWWQIKRTRWLGTGFLVASLVSAVILTAGMHDGMTKANGRISSARKLDTTKETSPQQPAKPDTGKRTKKTS